MAASIQFSSWDGSTVYGFRSWAKEIISDNMSALGFVKASDLGQVDWTKIVSAANLPRLFCRPQDQFYAFKGAWAAGTSYSGSTTDTNAVGNDVVTHTDGITYQCLNPTQMTTSVVNHNSTNTFNVTGVTVSGATTTYASTNVPNGLTGMVVVITGCTFANNNGTFIISSVTLNTSFTVTTINQSTETGSSGSASTSSNNTTYTFSGVSGVSNAYAGLNWTVAGYTGGNSGSNVSNVTCLASTNTQIGLPNATGVTASASGTITCVTAPPSDLYDTQGNNAAQTAGHWQPYLYEIWQTNDGLAPVYFRFLYGITQSAGTPWINFMAGNYTNGLGFVQCNNQTTSKNIAVSNSPALNITGDANTSDALIVAPTLSTISPYLGSTNPGPLYQHHVAGNGADGWFAFVLWLDSDWANVAVGEHTIIAFERARNASGGVIGDYWSMYMGGGGNTSGTNLNNTGFFQTVWSGFQGSSIKYSGANIPSLIIPSTLQVNGESPLAPVYPQARGYLGNPMTVIMAAPNTDNPIEGSIVTASSYGTVHTYIIYQSAKGSNTSGFGGSSALFPAVRFD